MTMDMAKWLVITYNLMISFLIHVVYMRKDCSGQKIDIEILEVL